MEVNHRNFDCLPGRDLLPARLKAYAIHLLTISSLYDLHSNLFCLLTSQPKLVDLG